MKERAAVMIRMARIMESLPTNAERRAVALDVWRTYGGDLPDLKRQIERERKAAQRDALECPTKVPEMSLNFGDKTHENGTISPRTPLTSERSFQIPESIQLALNKSDFLRTAPVLWKVEFWKAEIRANSEVDFAHEILSAEAWCQANEHRKPRKRVGQFMHRWLRRAGENGAA